MSSGDVRSEATRRANLIEVLQDAHESCPEIPEEAAARWSEEAIRRWFSTNGAERPADASAAMAALDVDGTPLPPSTRPDGMYLCQRIGCDAVYAPTDEGNPEGCCRHHAGPPVFHDGTKSWSCCGAKSHDFGEFMSLPGCAVGRHTQKKPPTPAPSPWKVYATVVLAQYPLYELNALLFLPALDAAGAEWFAAMSQPARGLLVQSWTSAGAVFVTLPFTQGLLRRFGFMQSATRGETARGAALVAAAYAGTVAGFHLAQPAFAALVERVAT